MPLESGQHASQFFDLDNSGTAEGGADSFAMDAFDVAASHDTSGSAVRIGMKSFRTS